MAHENKWKYKAPIALGADFNSCSFIVVFGSAQIVIANEICNNLYHILLCPISNRFVQRTWTLVDYTPSSVANGLCCAFLPCYEPWNS